MSSFIYHNWRLSKLRTPSGKLLYHCPNCGLYDTAPIKKKYDRRECSPTREIVTNETGRRR